LFLRFIELPFSPRGCPAQRTSAQSKRLRDLLVQLILQAFIHNLWIRFALRGLHDLTDKESKERFFATAILCNLIRIRRDNLVNYAIDFTSVADLHETLLFNNRRGRLTALEHFNQNVLALLAADFVFVNHANQGAEFRGGYR